MEVPRILAYSQLKKIRRLRTSQDIDEILVKVSVTGSRVVGGRYRREEDDTERSRGGMTSRCKYQ